MRRALLILALCLPSWGAWTITCAEAKAQTVTVNSTGATAILAYYVALTDQAGDIAESGQSGGSNLWADLGNWTTSTGNTLGHVWLTYGAALHTGSSHVISFAARNPAYVTSVACVITGNKTSADPLISSMLIAAGATTCQPGSYTAATGSLMLTILGTRGGTTQTTSNTLPDSPYADVFVYSAAAGVNLGTALATSTTSTGATNPTWTYPSDLTGKTCAILGLKAPDVLTVKHRVSQ